MDAARPHCSEMWLMLVHIFLELHGLSRSCFIERCVSTVFLNSPLTSGEAVPSRSNSDGQDSKTIPSHCASL